MVAWSDLEVFLAAVRAGSYTAAAHHLGIDRTTIGRRIDRLERALGVSLFEQTAHGPAPTSAGARVLAASEAMEREALLLQHDIAAGSIRQAPIRIAGSACLASEFMDDLSDFARQHPGCAIALLDELDPIEAVSQRRADLALALVRKPPLRLTGRQVAVVQQAPYARRGALSLPQLGWGLAVEAALTGTGWIAANPIGTAAIEAGLTTCDSWPQLKQAVLSGLGRASLCCFAGDAEPGLQRLAPPDPRHDCPLWLLHRATAPPTERMLRLMDFLESAIGTRIARPGQD